MPHPQGERASLLARHYPNDLLISGFDILFFWDARMAMQGMHFMREVPWRRLYLHGLVRAADGQKMSKSKGNVVDPLGLIDRYGADALRFFMCAMESQGRDVKMDEKRVEGYRNFATKLWNAARFCQANGIGASGSVAAPAATTAVNRWIISEVVDTLAKLDKAFEELRFDGMADTIYHFVWGTFCDWYLELIKPEIQSAQAELVEASTDTLRQAQGERAAETKAVAGWVLDQILVMLHPFMPFITEELWHALGDRPYDLIHAQWPKPEATVDVSATAQIEWVQSLIAQVRATKNDLGVPPGKTVTAFISKAEQKQFDWLNANLLAVKRMARLDQISVRTPDGFRDLGFELDGVIISGDLAVEVEGEGQVQLVADGIVGSLDFFGIVDLDAERARITKAIEAAMKEAKSLEGRLNNPAFVEKAKPEAVEKARADHAEKAAEAERLTAALARLGA